MPKKAAVTVALTLMLLLLIGSSVAFANLGPLTVSFIDVGQGDSILLRAPDGTDILIDGGPRAAGATVVAYLQEQQVDDIEVMMVTHPHEDHIGGLIAVLQSAIPVEGVIYSRESTTTVYNDFVAAMQAVAITPTPVAVGRSFTWGPMQAATLNPQVPPVGDYNEDSVVLLVTYGDNRFLLTGDIGSTTESTIMGSGTALDADVLKVAHHGSAYASSTAFLNAVTPVYAVICVGKDNTYGHPAQETLDRLAAVGADIYRTDLDGTIVLTSDGQTVAIGTGGDTYVVFVPLALRTSAPTPGKVEIVGIFYDGLVPYVESDEYATIKNTGGSPVELAGWRLNAGPGQDFVFPSFTMQPNQECRVYTNEVHPESCGFSFGSPTALWSNSGDCGYLFDETGTQVSTWCY